MLKDMVNGKLLAGFMFFFAIFMVAEGVNNFMTGDHHIRGGRGGNVLFAHPEWSSGTLIALGLLAIDGGVRMWINDEE